MATKEYFPGLGKIKFEGKIHWLTIIMMLKKSSWARK